jgi:uncharacterized protein (TIGR02246 family)
MRFNAGCLATLLVSASTVLAQNPPPVKSAPPPAGGAPDAASSQDSADTRAIRELVDTFVKSYNAKDSQTLGALFTPNAEIQDEDGEVTRGRDAIIARFARTFKEGESGTLSVASESLRFLGTDLGIEEGNATLSSAVGEPPRTNRYSVIYTREGDRWLHARIRDEPSGKVSPHERLQELQWMLGDWVNESDDGLVFTTCSWSKDGNFLLRNFDVKVEGRIALSGTQRIGWDAQKEQFRTWVFDTEGGFADGLMYRDGDRWVIKSTGARADGTPVSLTNSITVLGKDRIRWESSDRTVGDTPVLDTDRFDLVRRAPQPASQAPSKDQTPKP